MIDERKVELINAELDGELSPGERAELAQVLLADPEARAFREELRSLSGELAKLENVIPPADFATSVLSALRSRRAANPAVPSARRWQSGPALRYAAVFVGGLLASTLLLRLAMHDEARPAVSELVGTIGGQGGTERGAPIDRIDVALTQVRGTVNSYRIGTQLVVELDLTATEPVEVVLGNGDQTMRVSLGSQPNAGPERMLWLPDDPPGGRQIDIQVYGGGRLLHRAALRSSGAVDPE